MPDHLFDLTIDAAADGFRLRASVPALGEVGPVPLSLPFRLDQLPRERSRAAT